MRSNVKSPVEKTDQATFLFAYGVAEPDGILDALTADENSHVAAEPGLIVAHIASQRGFTANTASSAARTVRPSTSPGGASTWR